MEHCNDQSKRNYDAGNEIYNREVLKSNFCDYNGAYILVRGDITIVGDNGVQLPFENCATFIKCITKIDAEDLDIVMPIYNLLEYSWNYSDMKDSLRFYLKDEATTFNAGLEDSVAFDSFACKTKLVGEPKPQTTPDSNNGILKITIASP